MQIDAPSLIHPFTSPPERSQLYSLEPIGIGTTHVEGLSSYICRLADAHCVRPLTLLSKMVAPKLHGQRISGSFTWDGISKYTSSITSVLENLTYRSDIKELTLYHLNNVLSQTNLTKRTRAWCPLCYNEARETSSPLYHNLLWSISMSKHCLKHSFPIRTICLNPDCQKSIPYFSPLNGYCPHCNTWLGMDMRDNNEVDNLSLGIDTILSDMLQHNTGNINDMDKIIKNITSCIEIFFDGKVRNLERMAGKPRGYISNILQRKQTPSIEHYIMISMMCELTPYKMIFCEIAESESQTKRIKPHSNPSLLLHQELIRMFTQNILPPSFELIAQQLNTSQATVKRHCPEVFELSSMTKSIVKDYNKLKHNCDTGKLLGDLIDVAVETTNDIVSIMAFFDVGVVKFKELLRIMCQSLIKRQTTKNIVDIAQMETELSRILNEEGAELQTLNEIANRLNVRARFLREKFPLVHKEFQLKKTKLYKGEISGLEQIQCAVTLSIDAVTIELTRALGASNPVSLKSISDKLGMDKNTLIRLAPNECGEITKRYLEIQKNLTAQIRPTMFKLHDQGIYPSHKNLNKVLGTHFASNLRRSIIKETLKELGY